MLAAQPKQGCLSELQRCLLCAWPCKAACRASLSVFILPLPTLHSLYPFFHALSPCCSCMVVVGNGNGVLGWGQGKAAEVNEAVQKVRFLCVRSTFNHCWRRGHGKVAETGRCRVYSPGVCCLQQPHRCAAVVLLPAGGSSGATCDALLPGRQWLPCQAIHQLRQPVQPACAATCPLCRHTSGRAATCTPSLATTTTRSPRPSTPSMARCVAWRGT